MGINLRGIQVVMPQNLLNRPDVYAVLQHQRGGCVAELMGGVFALVDARGGETLFHHGMDRGAADPFITGG